MIIFRETFWNIEYWQECGLAQWQILIPAVLLGMCFALVACKLIKITRIKND
tara:strand:+ start:824 stop:979 length:156 start_codon:yes stop_codon:yes gene_type:complete